VILHQFAGTQCRVIDSATAAETRRTGSDDTATAVVCRDDRRFMCAESQELAVSQEAALHVTARLLLSDKVGVLPGFPVAFDCDSGYRSVGSIHGHAGNMHAIGVLRERQLLVGL